MRSQRRVKPSRHSLTRRTGTKFDRSATVAMPTGTFVTHFGKHVHFDGAKQEDAVLLIVGEGPGTSTPAEIKSRGANLGHAADLAAAPTLRAAGRSAVARLIRSSTRSIEATSMRLRPLSLAR